MSALLLAPLRVERAALSSGLRAASTTGAGVSTRAVLGQPGVPDGVSLRCTGMGRSRSAAALEHLAAELPWPGVVLVAGVGGGLVDRVRPGDVVVATEVWGPLGAVVPVPSAPLLALALRWSGLRVHAGPVLTTARVVDGRRRTELAASGALCVDTESAHLAAAAAPGRFAVVRVVVDTAEHPLRSPGTAGRGLAALRRLRRAAPVLARWAAGPPLDAAVPPIRPTPTRKV